MRCRSCGSNFNEDEAASTFNSYFDGNYDYDLNGWEGICADCAICNTEHDEEEGIDEDGIPVGCASCGGDWPNCTTGCPMYDD